MPAPMRAVMAWWRKKVVFPRSPALAAVSTRAEWSNRAGWSRGRRSSPPPPLPPPSPHSLAQKKPMEEAAPSKLSRLDLQHGPDADAPSFRMEDLPVSGQGGQGGDESARRPSSNPMLILHRDSIWSSSCGVWTWRRGPTDVCVQKYMVFPASPAAGFMVGPHTSSLSSKAGRAAPRKPSAANMRRLSTPPHKCMSRCSLKQVVHILGVEGVCARVHGRQWYLLNPWKFLAHNCYEFYTKNSMMANAVELRLQLWDFKEERKT